VRLHEVARFDERLAAHLDGLSVAGDQAWSLLEPALHPPSPGAMFTAVAWALHDARPRLDELFTMAQADRTAFAGLAAAFGWVEREQLEGIVSTLLDADDPIKREAGIAACAAHRVNPAHRFGAWLRDPAPAVRARAFRAIGEIGCHDLMSACVRALSDDDDECRFWAAWSAVLLGDRTRALQRVMHVGTTAAPHRARAFRLALQAYSAGAGHEILRTTARDPRQLRWTIEGCGLVGDVAYVPWLIRHMSSEQTCRVAGEAFSLMTGVDLSLAELERPAPDGADLKPNDDPADADIDVEPDEGLPWPDPARVEDWWEASKSKFVTGRRYFMGAPVTRDHGVGVLRSGCQRQRVAAAHHLCLLTPGMPLFNTSGPAWRQQRLLTAMA
jgi:uncharacterized protein (TIGR02270 family)